MLISGMLEFLREGYLCAQIRNKKTLGESWYQEELSVNRGDKKAIKMGKLMKKGQGPGQIPEQEDKRSQGHHKTEALVQSLRRVKDV